MRKDFEIFNRKIKSKAFFSHKTYKNKKPNQQTKNQTLKVKPIGNPIGNYHTVETFIEAVNKDIVERSSDKKKLPKSDLTDTD